MMATFKAVMVMLFLCCLVSEGLPMPLALQRTANEESVSRRFLWHTLMGRNHLAVRLNNIISVSLNGSLAYIVVKLVLSVLDYLAFLCRSFIALKLLAS